MNMTTNGGNHLNTLTTMKKNNFEDIFLKILISILIIGGFLLIVFIKVQHNEAIKAQKEQNRKEFIEGKYDY